MPFTSPLIPDISNADNTGEYKGFNIWVQGNGRVQVTRGPETWLFQDYIDAKYWIDIADENQPAPPPVLSSIDPATGVLNSADITMHCHGSGFTEESQIFFADNPEPIVFISDSDITTVITMSLPWGAVSVPVYVQNADGQKSATLDFTFTEEAAP